MVQKLITENIFIYMMLGLCGVGMLLKTVVWSMYQSLIKASNQMGTTKNKLMESLKLKFETCHRLEIGVHNVDSFVDKYVYKCKFFGIFLYTWECISGQLSILCLSMGVITGILGVLNKCGQTVILSQFLVGTITGIMLIIFEKGTNLHTKKKILKVNVTDYLENFLQVRLETEKLQPELLVQYKENFSTLENQSDIKQGKKAKKKVFRKKRMDKREQLEKLKQELVEELKQERMAKQEKEVEVQEDAEQIQEMSRDFEELVKSLSKLEIEKETAAAKSNLQKVMVKQSAEQSQASKQTIAQQVSSGQANKKETKTDSRARKNNKHAAVITKEEKNKKNEAVQNQVQEKIVEDILRQYLA